MLSPNDPTLRRRAAAVLDAAWREEGFCVPNQETYPFQWLWDSCFHAVAWAELGDERGVAELESLLAHQDASGFVPHLTHWADPERHRTFWGQSMLSTITQPPMFGHAAAELVRRGHDVDESTLERVERGLRHLLVDRPRTPAGLVPIFHPWESGCDDSPRWDHWRRDDASVAAWRVTKGRLVDALVVGPEGVPIGSSEFVVGSVGFNALLVWNVRELRSLGVGDELTSLESELSELLADRWDPERLTWIDDGPTDRGSGAATSAFVRTADSLLPLLVDHRPEALSQLVDDRAFGGEAGPSGVHRDEPMFDPGTYWRGGAWPQLTYLLQRAAREGGDAQVADRLAACLRFGVDESDFAEYWDPSTGEGFGACPQTWSALAICV